MTVRFKSLLTGLVLLLSGGAMALPAAAAPGDPLLDYGVDVVSNYVWRGVDLFGSTGNGGLNAQNEVDDGAFTVAPAVQPSLTLYGPGGFSFGLWGSFAATNREEDEKTGFAGLSTLDELDYIFAWDWSNKLGSFTAGIANYAIVPDAGAVTDVYFVWGMPFLESLSPTLTYNSDMVSAAAYTTLGISGGEAISWSASVGLVQKGIQDVTASIGYEIMSGLSVSLNASQRPNPELVGAYDEDGKYTNFDGDEADYPPVIAWLTLSWAGATVTE
jgi:hypothetical protein